MSQSGCTLCHALQYQPSPSGVYGPNQSLEDFDDFFSSRLGLSGQQANGQVQQSTPTPHPRRNISTSPNTTTDEQLGPGGSHPNMSSSGSPTASPMTSRRNMRNRSMRKPARSSRAPGAGPATSTLNLAQSNGSLDGTGRTSSIENHVSHNQTNYSNAMHTSSGIANLQAKVQQLENDLRERGEQILHLRRESRKMQARLDESNDQLAMQKATHEKILEDIQLRAKRQVDAAKRNVHMELNESQEVITELTQRLQDVEVENKKDRENADRFKDEHDRVAERLQVTSSQLVDMSAQCRKLTENAMNRDQDNRQTLEQQRQENVQSEELLQTYQKQIYELQLELEQAKNDTSLQLEINRLRSQLTSIGEDNDDLKAQLLKQNIERARELAEQSSASLAAEIDTVDKSADVSINGHDLESAVQRADKLQRELKSCKSNNQQMRDYLDKILQSILEKDPSILEVK